MESHPYPDARQGIFELHARPCLASIRHVRGGRDRTSDSPDFRQSPAFLVFVIDGRGKAVVNEKTYALSEDQVLLIPAKATKSFTTDPAAPLEFWQIGIADLAIKGLPKGAFQQPEEDPLLSARETRRILLSYVRILYEFQKRSDGAHMSEAIGDLVASLVTFLRHELEERASHAPEMQDYHLGVRAKEYIDAHFREDISLKTIAKALNVNVYYLSHTFKALVGHSPIQYMIHRRMTEAQNLLLTTDATITEIALRCGYNNTNYFQVAFNRLVGMPPGKYRKTWK